MIRKLYLTAIAFVQPVKRRSLYMKMDETDRNKLRLNHLELIKNLNPEDVTDYLYQEGILGDEDIEKINVAQTRHQKVRDFLNLLRTKSGDALDKFVEALREGGYGELASNIGTADNTKSTGAIQASDSRELQELKEKLNEQSEMMQEMKRELDQVYLNLLHSIYV